MEKNGEKLKELLNGLCSTNQDNEILGKLCENIKNITESTIEFKEGVEFEYEKSEDVNVNIDLPKSFAEIASIFSSFTWDGGGPEVGFELYNGIPAGDGWLIGEIEEEEMNRIETAAGGEAMVSFSGGQNILFFDPTRKLKNGEPALAFISHEECEWEEVKSVDSLNYKQILLRMISDAAISTKYIPEIYF